MSVPEERVLPVAAQPTTGSGIATPASVSRQVSAMALEVLGAAYVRTLYHRLPARRTKVCRAAAETAKPRLGKLDPCGALGSRL